MPDLIKTLPSDPAERKRLKGVVSELVDLIMQEQDIKSQMKDIKDVQKEDHGYDTKYITFLAQMQFDHIYESEKKRADLEAKNETLAELDIIFNRTEQ